MSVTAIPAIYKDSIIALRTRDGEKIYRVKKFNPTALILIDEDGHEGRLPTKSDSVWSQVREATGPEAETFRATEFANTVVLRVGNIVRWPACTHAAGKGLMVVTKVNSDGDANLAPLGGNLTGEFFRSVPARLLQKITVDEMVTVTNA